MEQITKPVIQTDSPGQSDALFLVRLQVEEQSRFARRLVAGLSAFLLLWLAGLWYFGRELPLAGRSSAQMAVPKAQEGNPESAQVKRLNLELARLQDQLGKAVAETLHLKLETLEGRIRGGQTGLKDLELLQSIKQDIRLLAARGNDAVLPQVETEAVLWERFGRLESLVYFSLGAFGAVFIALGGYFLKCSIKLKRLERDLAKVSGQLLLERHS